MATRHRLMAIDYLSSLQVGHVLVCGLQAEIRCLTAGGALLDAGSQPTPIMDLTVGRRWIGGRDWACGGGSIMSGTR